MLGNREWSITGADATVIVANRVRNDIPQYRRGKTMRLEFVFYEEDASQSDTGGEYGYTEYGNFTYSGSSGFRGLSGYKQFRQYGDYAGAYANGFTYNRIPWFREQLPEEAPINSLVISVKPGSNISDNFPGFWALVDDMTDISEPTMNYFVLDTNLLVLGEIGEFGSTEAVKTELEA